MPSRACAPKPASLNEGKWHEVIGPDGAPRPLYAGLLSHLNRLKPSELRFLEERMTATLREMGVTFDLIRNDPWGHQPWACDLLPHILNAQEWDLLSRGFRQRLRAFELFLSDIYGPKDILRAGVLPVPLVLGSPHFQAAASGLPRPRNSFLHLSGICVTRDASGRHLVRRHHFAQAHGISQMLQNRRALARILPSIFQENAVQSLTDAPLLILEQLRASAQGVQGEPTVVLLAAGENSAAAAEQSFLARRMGIPVVESGDLLVLDDKVFLKTVRGLKRVEVIGNGQADSLLDPLVFGGSPTSGVAGLVHCLRKGSVSLLNAIGSQLADDQTLLAFSQQIIGFYLAETPVLPCATTYWLGDIDQREHVLESPDRFRIESLRPTEQGHHRPPALASVLADIRRQPHLYIAQPKHLGSTTLCFHGGKPVEQLQEHVLFAVRTGSDFTLLPGALTRVLPSTAEESVAPRTCKDTWILEGPSSDAALPFVPRRVSAAHLPARQVTSRVADALYWMGRYLERAHHQAQLIALIETLESEELNSAERKLYRPIWNRLLPPIEKTTGASRRSIANTMDRYRLLLLPEPGSVVHAFLRAASNAYTVPDSISPEALATLNQLSTRFQRKRFRSQIEEEEAQKATRRLAEHVIQLVPQFFAISANTMLADDGWRFCELGQMLERAIITANSVLSISGALSGPAQGMRRHGTEIELSAFLRLLGCRDAYRRIFQMRAEPLHVLELLWQHPEVPRSLVHCLERCRSLLQRSMPQDAHGQLDAPAAVDALLHRIRRIDWRPYVPFSSEESHESQSAQTEKPSLPLEPLLKELLESALELHTSISDGFLNHQSRIAQFTQPLLSGLS
ncbi:MAG: hypothetical protein RLZZ253_809 [Verrucomicrobiota bacterium]